MYTLMTVLGLVLLMWSIIILNSPASEKAQSYLEVLKIFFHPLSLPNSIGLGEKMISIVSTSLFVTGAIWISAYISSAQPYIRWLRTSGNIFGVLAVLVWVSIVFIVFFLSGMRH
jgi:hypothetical protein